MRKLRNEDNEDNEENEDNEDYARSDCEGNWISKKSSKKPKTGMQKLYFPSICLDSSFYIII